MPIKGPNLKKRQIGKVATLSGFRIENTELESARPFVSLLRGVYVLIIINLKDCVIFQGKGHLNYPATLSPYGSAPFSIF